MVISFRKFILRGTFRRKNVLLRFPALFGFGGTSFVFFQNVTRPITCKSDVLHRYFMTEQRRANKLVWLFFFFFSFCRRTNFQVKTRFMQMMCKTKDRYRHQTFVSYIYFFFSFYFIIINMIFEPFIL